MTSTAFGIQPDGYYYLGEAVAVINGATYRRMIVAHTGNEIVIQYPFIGLTAPVNITVYAGCDKKAETCLNRFNNILNFTGFPYMTEEII